MMSSYIQPTDRSPNFRLGELSKFSIVVNLRPGEARDVDDRLDAKGLQWVILVVVPLHQPDLLFFSPSTKFLKPGRSL